MAVYEELETKLVWIPDGRILMLYRSCALGESHPAKDDFQAVIYSEAEMKNYIFCHRENFGDAPVVLRGKEATCRDYAYYLERCLKRAISWEKLAAQYPSMYAEEILGWNVYAEGVVDHNPPKQMSRNEFKSLWALHGGRGIIARPKTFKTRDIARITSFMNEKGASNPEGIRFRLGKKAKAA